MYCDRNLIVAGSQHAAPFVETSSAPEDFSQALRQNLLEGDSDEADAIAAAAAEFIADDTDLPLTGFDPEGPDEPLEPGLFQPFSDKPAAFSSGSEEPVQYEMPAAEPEPQLSESDLHQEDPAPLIYDEPQSDLRRSLYDDDVVEEAPPSYKPVGTVASNYVEPADPGSDSGIWMAGADADDHEYLGGTGPLGDSDDLYGRSAAGSEGVSELRADVSGPPGQLRRMAGRVARFVIIIAVLGAATWGLYTVSQGPVGAFVAEALATDIPTDTPIPEPTATLRPAPTLPPEATEEAAILPTEIGTSNTETGCLPWDAITLDDAGSEVCGYGVIKRWWAGEEIPFIAIFSEDVGTFAIIDRTTRHPVGPGSCIMASGIVEIMGGTRPNIDAQGSLEACPEGLVEE
jgi:hypothetical protein